MIILFKMYIDPDLVINKDNFKLIEFNVICSICNGIVVSPVQCLECENCFCKICIESWKKKSGDSCPFRCKNPSFKDSRLIKSILSNIKFKCKNGCNEEIPYLELENHYEENCPNIIKDYKQKYFELQKKYLDILKKNKELEFQLNKNNHLNNNTFKSIYHSDILYDKTNSNSDWNCDICDSSYNAKTEKRFRCENCDFDICMKCKILEEYGYKFNNVFLSKNHKHLLKKCNKPSSLFSRFWSCDKCDIKVKIDGYIERFRCNLCDYDICNNCKNDEENNLNQLNDEMNNMHIED